MTRLGTFSLIDCTVDQLGIGGDPSSFDEIKLIRVDMSKLNISTISTSNTLTIKRSVIDEIKIDEAAIRNTTIHTRANSGCDLSTRSLFQNEFKISGSYERILLTQGKIYSLTFEKVRSEQISIMEEDIALFAGNIRFNTDSLNLNTVKIGLPYVTPF